MEVPRNRIFDKAEGGKHQIQCCESTQNWKTHAITLDLTPLAPFHLRIRSNNTYAMQVVIQQGDWHHTIYGSSTLRVTKFLGYESAWGKSHLYYIHWDILRIIGPQKNDHATLHVASQFCYNEKVFSPAWVSTHFIKRETKQHRIICKPQNSSTMFIAHKLFKCISSLRISSREQNPPVSAVDMVVLQIPTWKRRMMQKWQGKMWNFPHVLLHESCMSVELLNNKQLNQQAILTNPKNSSSKPCGTTHHNLHCKRQQGLFGTSKKPNQSLWGGTPPCM